jgi:hypothetical protein
MGIKFDQVEGVVQKAAEPATQPADGASSTPKPTHESHDEARHRMERRSRRLHAD